VEQHRILRCNEVQPELRLPLKLQHRFQHLRRCPCRLRPQDLTVELDECILAAVQEAASPVLDHRHPLLLFLLGLGVTGDAGAGIVAEAGPAFA
jgi:hypothetical protein